MRLEIANGQQPQGCVRCWNDEAAGLESKRTIDNKFIFNSSATYDNSIKVLSVSFGNTCNLACVTCNSSASSRWAPEEKKLQNQGIIVNILGHKKFYKDNKFLEDLRKISNNLIDVTFPGGEPFITGIDQQISYLDFLIENDASGISLTYITNTTTFPSDEFWERWKKFKQVNIQLSIDSINEKFEYIRWPANWDNCYNNIKKYQQIQKTYYNLVLSVGHTVSVFNVFYLPEFIIWCFKEKLPQPYIGMVEYPDYYNVRSLTAKVKQQIKNKLNQSSKFDNVASFMMQPSEIEFDQTQQKIRILDQHRLQDFNAVFPELMEYNI